MQHSDGVFIKKDKNTLANMQTKVQVMHYTDNNEEGFFYSTALLQVHSVLWDWFGEISPFVYLTNRN